MQVKHLIRDASKIHECLQELPDGQLVTKKLVKIYIPARFTERNLATIGVETYIVGIYAMVLEDQYYAVSMVNAMVRIDPDQTNRVKIDEDDYLEFVFTPGSTVIPSVQLVKTGSLVYRIYDEFFGKGRVPWYLGYRELAQIFDTASYHAGASVGTEHEVSELLVSIVARSAQDRTRYYRQTVTDVEAEVQNPPVFIPLRSVVYAATNTTNKLAGSYMQDGIISALNSPSTRSERIEDLLTR